MVESLEGGKQPAYGLKALNTLNSSSLFHLQDAGSSSPQPGKQRDDESKTKEKWAETRKWAIPVNVTSPCEDFYKRIPNPAFQAGRILPFPACFDSFLVTSLRVVPSGRSSWMFSRSRPSSGWRSTTPCLWPRTRLPAKRWWPSTPSLFPRNT